MKDSVTGLHLVPHAVELDKQPDRLLMRSRVPLDPVVEKTGGWLHRWAEQTPGRVFLAERLPNPDAAWRELTFAEVLASVRAIASSLAGRGLNAETPIIILSGNGVDHALLSLAAQYAGVPTVPVAEQYSLIPEAHARLQYVVDKVKPAIAFVDDAERYSAALALHSFDDLLIIASQPEGSSRDTLPFDELLLGDPAVDIDAVHARVGPDTLAKILFTSGSSSDPKGVMTTQRMMCANQAQMASVLPFLKERPPSITDWLPWNHVFGGSHNLNMMLAHGGSLYIDHGKPTRSAFARTVQNLIDRPPTLAFNVPVGFAMLVSEMQENTALRRAFFADLDMIFYAGASLPQDVWQSLEQMAMDVRGRLPLMISSWGMTETAPATIMLHEPIGRSGVVGVPLPGTEIKLLPDEDQRCELRVRGLNVTPGYWDDEARSQQAFDEEGYLITGDAVRFVDNDDPDQGLVFDGRVAEDFKLLTGTWVHAGKLRLEALAALQGLVQDVVICGHDRHEIGLFIFPRPDQLHGDDQSGAAVIDAALQLEIEQRLCNLAASATGSAKRIARALLLAEAASLQHGEVTDKGSLNVRKILTRRAALLDRLYDNEDPALIRIRG